jgi:ferric-dicitrate binding protein FerR (iron transport regulator)
MNQPSTHLRGDSDLTALIEAVLNGQADDSQFAELDQRLSTDAAARDVYATYINVDCELRARFAVEGDIVGLEAELERELRDGDLADFRQTLAAESLARKPGRFHFMPWMSLLAVCALVAIGVAVWQPFKSPEMPLASALAHVRDLEGAVTILRSTDTPARIGDALLPGDRLRTDEQDARAVLEYADGTTVEVHVDSAVQFPAAGDVRLRLLSGSIDVDATPQPADRPLIIATDHARYVVLGTRFRLYRSEDATRLELNEGKVRLERKEENRVVETVQVEAGSAAIASAQGVPVEVVPLAAGKAHVHKRLEVTGQDVIHSPAGDQVIVNDSGRGLAICRSDDFAVQFEYPRDGGPSYGLALAPDGQSVVRLSHDHVLLWKFRDTEGRARKLSLPRRGVRSRALSPNGRIVAESSDEGIELFTLDLAGGALKPWMVLPNRNGKSGKAWCLAFSQDGSRLVAGFYSGTLRIYRLDLGRIAAPSAEVASPSDLSSENGRIGNPSYDVAHEYQLSGTVIPASISGDGRYLAAFTRADGLQMIDTASGEQQSLWSSTGASVGSLRFTPDGRWLMAGCSDRTVRLWSVANGRPILVLETDHTASGTAWLPTQRQLITADGGVKVWNVEISRFEEETTN